MAGGLARGTVRVRDHLLAARDRRRRYRAATPGPIPWTARRPAADAGRRHGRAPARNTPRHDRPGRAVSHARDRRRRARSPRRAHRRVDCRSAVGLPLDVVAHRVRVRHGRFGAAGQLRAAVHRSARHAGGRALRWELRGRFGEPRARGTFELDGVVRRRSDGKRMGSCGDGRDRLARARRWLGGARQPVDLRRACAGGGARRPSRKLSSASATARQAARETAMPQWEAPISTSSVGVRVEARAPVDHAVALRVDRHERDAARERPARGRPRTFEQQSPSRHERLNSPGAPSEPSRLTASTWSRTSGCTASGSICGAPSATTPDTRSGRRFASTLAIVPPRLWPTTAARRP